MKNQHALLRRHRVDLSHVAHGRRRVDWLAELDAGQLPGADHVPRRDPRLDRLGAAEFPSAAVGIDDGDIVVFA